MDGPSGDIPSMRKKEELGLWGKESNYREQNTSFLLGIGDYQLKIGCGVACAIPKTFKKAGRSNCKSCLY